MNIFCLPFTNFKIEIFFTILFLGKGKVWTCIARTSYKNLPIKSLGFSSDTSLLGVGFGNTLCIYNSETLNLRCALSAPSGLDGSVSKMSITLPGNNDKSDLDRSRKKFIEKRKKLLAAIRSILENDETVTVAKGVRNANQTEAGHSRRKLEHKLSDEQKKMVFNQVLASNSINLFQKIHIYDKFNLHGRVAPKWQQPYVDYCDEIDNTLKSHNILGRMLNLSSKHKFKFAHKYSQTNLQKQKNRLSLDSLNRVVNFSRVSNTKKVTNGVSGDMKKCSADKDANSNHMQKPTVQITHIAFCTGEFAHLVIVCTEKRLLIWNLLTLRLQSAFKIAVEKMTVDLYTSLVAIVSKHNDLYVFLPNTPITLYQHKQLPKIDGMAWIPRQYPRSHSLTIDWQAHTELYFLSSDKQVKIFK